MIEQQSVVIDWLLDVVVWILVVFFFSSRRRHTRFDCDWSSDVCSSDLVSGYCRCAIPSFRAGLSMVGGAGARRLHSFALRARSQSAQRHSAGGACGEETSQRVLDLCRRGGTAGSGLCRLSLARLSLSEEFIDPAAGHSVTVRRRDGREWLNRARVWTTLRSVWDSSYGRRHPNFAVGFAVWVSWRTSGNLCKRRLLGHWDGRARCHATFGNFTSCFHE